MSAVGQVGVGASLALSDTTHSSSLLRIRYASKIQNSQSD